MRLLVTRPREDAEALSALLAQRGHSVLRAPLLDIAFLPGPPVAADGVQAILFTSANGVRALLARNGADLGGLTAVPVFAVGDATARAAREAGFAHIDSADGDVAALAERVAALCDPSRGELLHLSGADAAGDLAGDLGARGFRVRRESLYEAHKAEALDPEVVAALRRGEIDAVLLFSPRTAKAFVGLIDKAGLQPTLGRVIALCLSRAVADAADDLPPDGHWRDMVVAPQPTQEALLATLDRLAERESGPWSQPQPLPAPSAEPAAATGEAPKPPPPAPRRRGHGRKLLVGLAVVALLVGGTIALWPQTVGRLTMPPPAPDRPTASAPMPAPPPSTLAETTPAQPAPRDEGELRRTLAAVEARLAELEQRPPPAYETPPEPAPPAPSVPPELTGRLDEVERRLAELAARPAVAPERLDNAAAALDERLGRLERELADLARRVEGRLAAQAEAERRIARGETLAFGGVLLREALAQGKPFAEALPPLRAAVADDAALAERLDRLAPAAATGLPTREALRERFAEQARSWLPQTPPPADEGFLAQTWRRLQELVTIRRLDDAAAPIDATSAPDRLLARAESRLAGDDLAGAVAALELLAARPQPPEAQASLQAWLGDARARLEAEALLTDLLARGLAATGAAAQP